MDEGKNTPYLHLQRRFVLMILLIAFIPLILMSTFLLFHLESYLFLLILFCSAFIILSATSDDPFVHP